MRRAVPLAFLLLAGCEEQDAIPLSRSVPVALAMLGVLAVVVVGGYSLLERRYREARQVGRPPLAGVRCCRLAGAAVATLAAAAIVGLTLLFISTVAIGYREITYQVLSWTETVGITWFLVVVGGAAALGELRLAAAFARQLPWAPYAAAAQLGLVALPNVLGRL